MSTAPLHFEHVYNFRDVGQTVNAFLKKNVIKEGILYRSARLDLASSADRDLLHQLNIKTVIDLRTKSEHKLQDGRVPSAKAMDWGIVKVNFLSREFEIMLVKQLRWWRMIMFILFHVLHMRIPALQILGKDVLAPKGLVGLCKDSLDYSKPQILETLTSALQGPRPVLIHCTQGKDRTGLIFALILLLLEVPEEAINHDYLLSDEGLAPIRPQMIEEVKEIGMGEDYTRAAPSFVREMRTFLDDKYGGVRNYLNDIGFGKDKQQELEDLLRA